MTSELGTLPESAEPGTVVALISVQGTLTQVQMGTELPYSRPFAFTLKSAFRNQVLPGDCWALGPRGQTSHDIMVNASDAGSLL